MGRFEALGLREEKLVGAPIESVPAIIWDGRATLAATMAICWLGSAESDGGSCTDAG